MAYPYYAPYSRPMGYYNPSIPQENLNMQGGQQIPTQQQTQQPIQQMPMQTPTPFVQSQPTNDMLFVLNENEASAFPVAPNNSVVLWDKNHKTFYIKTANAQGIPSMQTYDFTQRIENAPNLPTEHVCKCGNDFIPKSELNVINSKFDDILSKISDLEENVKRISTKPTAKTTKTTKSEE
jgi:hypothetical protein